MTITTTITPLSDPPSRNSPTDFAAKADTFLGELPTFGEELNDVITEMNATASDVSDDAATASAAAISATASASSASTSASTASTAATNAVNALDSFDDRYLGSKTSNPTVDNDGNSLLTGALYFNSSANEMRVWNGSSWQAASTVGGTVSSLNVTGNVSYGGTLTGSTGVMNIGSGQLYKDASGNFGLGTTPSPASAPTLDFVNGTITSNVGPFSQMAISGNAYSTGSTDIGFATWRYKRGISGDLGRAAQYRIIGGEHEWYNAPLGLAGDIVSFARLMKLNTSGQLLLGQDGSFAGGKIELASDTNAYLGFGLASGLLRGVLGVSPGSNTLLTGAVAGDFVVRGENEVKFGIGATEAARITLSRFFKTSNTASYGGVAGLTDQANAPNYVMQSNANGVTLIVANGNTGSSVTNITSWLATGAAGNHFAGYVNGGATFEVLANGNVQNANNSYGAISDAKLKNVIGPAPSYWEKYKLLEWVKYTLLNDPDNQAALGLIAQQCRDIFPGLVIETPDLVDVEKTREVTKTVPVKTTETQENTRTEIVLENGEYIQKTITESVEVEVQVYDEFDLKNEDGEVIGVHKVPRMETITETETYTEKEPNGEVTLSIKYSIIGHIADVVLQEAMARIEDQESIIQALTARIEALEQQ